MFQSDTKTVPTHLGIILDGNRRWAKSRGLPTVEGHRRGAEVFKEISKAAFERGVKYVSAYVFSTENWRRTQDEVSYLMSLVIKVVDEYLEEVHQEGIKIVILGRREGLKSNVLKAIARAEQKTAGNTRGTIALCFNYGGQQEIADAVMRLLEQGVDAQRFTPEMLEGALYHPEIPELDLILRTSGEQRLSNFMLYRSAYAELAFVPQHWPDFGEADLDALLADYATRQRRLGA
jgi:undecaprenyl diphosphate synthase